MNSFRISKIEKSSINDTILAMNRMFKQQRAQNISSYTSMSNMMSTLQADLVTVNNLISNYTYQIAYMKSLIENL